MLETTHHWLPIIIAVFMPVSFLITYFMAIGYKHVEPGFPYISDTGTTPPESCVFGQLLNFGAVLAGTIAYIRYRHGIHHFENTGYVTVYTYFCYVTAGTIVYIRYRHGIHHFESTGRPHLIRLNIAAFILGSISTVGVSIVANFQETNVFAVHMMGAFFAFLVGFVYMILQTIISYKSIAFGIDGNTLPVRRVRVGLCVVDSILLILIIVTSRVAKAKFSTPSKSKRHWSSDDGGYAEHLVATISEWLVAFVTVIFFATFYTEFKHFQVKPPEIVYNNDERRRIETS